MPLYEYECEACAKRFEVIQKFSDLSVDVCRLCGKGPVRRLLSSPAIQFKGSGWYITDYAQKGRSESAGKSESTAPAGKTEKTETKTESAKTSTDSSSTSSSSSSSAPPTKP
jgi:putative FmdB family regulatory protein